MGLVMEALRAPSKSGPRAALTRRGEPRVPEPGEKHGQGEDVPLQPPARTDARWGEWALVWSCRVAGHETG